MWCAMTDFETEAPTVPGEYEPIGREADRQRERRNECTTF